MAHTNEEWRGPRCGRCFGGLTPDDVACRWCGAPARAPLGTNGFAVAALVFGVLGGLVLAPIFAIVALVQIRRRGQPGKGLAIAGLALSGAWMLLLAVGAIVVLSSEAERDDATGEVVEGGSVSLEDLRQGDCVNGLEENELELSADVVPCHEPHEGEVFATFEIPGRERPPDAELFEMAESGCAERLEDYASGDVAGSVEIFYFHPTESSWDQGDREIICVAREPNQKRTGSIRG